MKNLLLLLLLFFLATLKPCFSQNDGWDILNIGQTLTSNNKYAVGSTCSIFAENNSNKVYVFNSITGNWDSTLISTTLEWTDAKADGNTAMLVNDSLVVFYSSLNNSFVVLRFDGQILEPSIKLFDCKENMGYVVSDQKFYVFDSEISQIISSNYVQVGTTPYAQVFNGNDYLCFYLSASDLTTHTLVAYSSITKTIADFTSINLYIFRQLEHGFIFGNFTPPNYICGGYSANTGSFSTKTSDVILSDVLHQYDIDKVYPRLCYLFISRSEVVDDIATYYLWVYNTLVGEFDEFSYQYNYNQDHLVPSVSGTGGQGIFHSTYDKDNGDKVNLITYDVYSRSFTQHDFNITYDYRNTFNIGGHIISISTENKLVFYDFICNNYEFYCSDWEPSTFPNIQCVELGNNYAALLYYKGPGVNGKTAFSYNGTTDSLKLVSFPQTNSFLEVFGSIDYSLIKFVNYTEAAEHIIYSNAKDNWIIKPFPSGLYSQEKKGYYFIIDNNLNTTYIFNPINGDEFFIPIKNQGTIFLDDSIFVIPANDLNFYGYSSIANKITSHPNIYYSGTAQSDRIIIRYSQLNSNDPSHLLYDGNIGIFITLSTNSQTYGTRLLTAAGIKTALTVYSKGYLIAYEPTELTDVEEPLEIILPNKFLLYQNYPNPFNPSTKISWQLPKAGNVEIILFNCLGEELEILVDEFLQAGLHSKFVTLNSKFPSGVYFYQIRSGDFIKTKKMILLK